MMKAKLVLLVFCLPFVFGDTARAITAEQLELYASEIEWFDIDGGSCDPSAPGTTVGVAGEDAEARREQAYNYFVAADRGLTPEQSAGIIGNLMIETGGTMDPAVEQDFRDLGFNPDLETGYGLAQWTSIGRKYNLLNFANATNRPIDDFYMQLDFIWFEMTGEPPVDGLSAGERRAYSALLATNTTEEAAVSFARMYERNQDSIDFGKGEMTYEEAFRGRINAAEDAYAAYAGSFSGSVPFGASDSCISPVVDGQCAPGTVDLGVHETWESGVQTQSVLCAMTNLPSDGAASSPTSTYYVNGANGNAIVRANVSAAAYQMVEDAAADGVVLRARSSFRPHAQQIDLCNNNELCRNENYSLVAKPGSSSHESGTAFDFYNMSSSAGGQTCSTRSTYNSDEYRWMFNNAENYGYLQYSKEAWHWDTRSDLNNRCDSSET